MSVRNPRPVEHFPAPAPAVLGPSQTLLTIVAVPGQAGMSTEPCLRLYCPACGGNHLFTIGAVERIVYALGRMVPEAYGVGRDDEANQEVIDTVWVPAPESSGTPHCLFEVLDRSKMPFSSYVDIGGYVDARTLSRADTNTTTIGEPRQ